MNTFYKAKVVLNGKRLTFEINDNEKFEDAIEFAKSTVRNWLEKHGDDIDHEMISIKYLGNTHDFRVDELYQ